MERAKRLMFGAATVSRTQSGCSLHIQCGKPPMLDLLLMSDDDDYGVVDRSKTFVATLTLRRILSSVLC